MKRGLIVLLLVVIAAVWLGSLIANDPGYVLIAYRDYTMQTSLWVMLAVFVTLALLVHYGLRMINMVRRTPDIYRDWRTGSEVGKAYRLTVRAMALSLDGEYDRARRYFESSAKSSTPDQMAQGVNYLAAARAAEDAGDSKAGKPVFDSPRRAMHRCTLHGRP